MKLVVDPAELLRVLDNARAEGKTVGVVPTMGALHAGHLSLVDLARANGADFLVLTVFVNPTQFNQASDLAAYPRTLDEDMRLARARGVDVVFAPDVSAMYPAGFSTFVDESTLSARWEGEHRPGHFRGVATVCTKLLSLMAPAKAVFGEKDFQQLAVIRRLATDLNLRVEVLAAPTEREPDGLAMSSRNRRLSPADRARAQRISVALGKATAAFRAGERDAERLRAMVSGELTSAVDAIDYVAVANPSTLAPLEGAVTEAVVLVAVHVGGVRLIDNIRLGS